MFTTIDKAIAATIVSVAAVWITKKTGLPVPMEYTDAAQLAIIGILTGSFTWLFPNKKGSTQ